MTFSTNIEDLLVSSYRASLWRIVPGFDTSVGRCVLNCSPFKFLHQTSNGVHINCMFSRCQRSAGAAGSEQLVAVSSHATTRRTSSPSAESSVYMRICCSRAMTWVRLYNIICCLFSTSHKYREKDRPQG